MKNYTFHVLFLLLLLNSVLHAQFNFTLTQTQQCFSGGNNVATASVSGTVASTTNYTWNTVSSSCGATFTLAAGNGSIINLSFPCAGTYTINGYAMNGASVLSMTSQVVNINPLPVINATIAPLANPSCAGSTFSMSLSGAVTYSWTTPPIVTNGTFIPLSSGCCSIAGSSALGCVGTTVACYTVIPNPTLTVTGPGTLCPGVAGTLIASGASTYSWIPTSISGPIAIVMPSVSTCYTVLGSNPFGCVSSASVCVILNNSPTLTISGNNQTCQGVSQTLTAGGALSYSWSIGSTNSSITVNPTSNTCYSLAGTAANGCTNFAVHCITVHPAPVISIAGNTTVCLGSSVNYTASGAISYTWNTGPAIYTNTLSLIPSSSFTYMAYGTGTNGCVGFASLSNSVNSNCANVWPGDANRDGVVSNTDVLELGLAANNTGPVRTPTSNAWSSQYANAWTGTVSTGWNQAHADCNGDGVINSADNTAISLNFGLTHGFKGTEINPANPDISLLPAQPFIYAGSWNRADIMLGDASNILTQLYGVAFDVDFDQSLVQSDSVKIIYTPSFLNASNQNIEFGKTVFANSKYYAASVRTDHGNVSGNGKIGEFWYKLNNVVPANSVMNLSVSNAIKVSSNGISNSLSAGSSSVAVSNSPVGLKESLNLEQFISVYPNPACNNLTLHNASGHNVTYSLVDVLGRELLRGEFAGIKTLDISSLQQGAYFIEFELEGLTINRKLVVEQK